MANLRALLLTPDFPPMSGGIELVMRKLIGELRTTDVEVVTLGVAGDTAYDRQQPLRIVRVGNRGERNRAANALLNARGVQVGLRRRPDLLICGHAVAAPATLALRRLLGRPSLQYVHAEECRDRPRVSALAVRGADAVVAVSRYSVDLAVAAGAAPERVHCVHPGVDLPPPFRGEKSAHPTLITVARLADRHKGHDVLLRAMPLIRERVPNAEWIIIGDGPLRPELEDLARQQGIADAVRFLGRVPDQERDAWLARSHIFAMPNRAGEGFGIAFLEAAAHGLPVVAGAVGGALDAVVDGETGLLADARDPRAVAQAVVDLLSDPQRSARMGLAGAHRARQFTWSRHAGAVEAILVKLHAAAGR